MYFIKKRDADPAEKSDPEEKDVEEGLLEDKARPDGPVQSEDEEDTKKEVVEEKEKEKDDDKIVLVDGKDDSPTPTTGNVDSQPDNPETLRTSPV